MSPQSTRQIPWLRVFVEGVVIVGSIRLAFGIQAWWDERGASAASRQLLQDLLAEFGQVEEELERAAAG